MIAARVSLDVRNNTLRSRAFHRESVGCEIEAGNLNIACGYRDNSEILIRNGAKIVATLSFFHSGPYDPSTINHHGNIRDRETARHWS